MGYYQPFLGVQESQQCPGANVLWLCAVVPIAQVLRLNLIVQRMSPIVIFQVVCLPTVMHLVLS